MLVLFADDIIKMSKNPKVSNQIRVSVSVLYLKIVLLICVFMLVNSYYFA